VNYLLVEAKHRLAMVRLRHTEIENFYLVVNRLLQQQIASRQTQNEMGLDHFLCTEIQKKSVAQAKRVS
jgi:hypothetical protein